MSTEKYGRKVFYETEVSSKNLDTGENTKNTIVFSNMLPEDLTHMREIHNQVWPSNLALTQEQFESYHTNFNDVSIAALVVDGSDPNRLIPVGGINAMRVNMVMDLDLPQHERWEVNEGDRIPPSWDECTNYGWFDTEKSRGPATQIWPSRKGRTIICPTVYVKTDVRIGEHLYRPNSLMKEIILAVNNVAMEISEKEGRSIHITAYSAPRNLEFWYKDHKNKEQGELAINDYYLMSRWNKPVEKEWRDCLEETGLQRDAPIKEIEKSLDKIKETIAKRKMMVYAAYKKSGGKLLPFEFDEKDIFLLYSILDSGKTAYFDYVKRFGPTDIEDFLRRSGRQLLDSVIGRHISFGAKIGKIIPNSRMDPGAMNYNTIMVYPTVVPEKRLDVEVVPPKTQAEDATM